LTCTPTAKFVPEIVTLVPPVAGPDVGETAVTVGGTYVKTSPEERSLSEPPTPTRTSTAPDPAGETAVNVVEFTNVTLFAGFVPK